MAKSWVNGAIILTTQGDGFSGRTLPIDTSVNPDGTWVTNPATKRKSIQFRANSITVDPSAASWTITLNNQDGTPGFSTSGATATSATFPGKFDFNGIVMSVATNVTRVILSEVERVEW